jgi:TonB-dependent SusC/RagA subfamily outer membrane receptor
MPLPRPALVVLLLAASGCWSGRTPATSAPRGAHTTVDVTAADGQSSRIEAVLARRVPGLSIDRRPDGTFAIRMRGAGAGAASGGEPLVLLDGIPMAGPAGNALADIDPQEVDRVEVIRDAASLSLYGVRGAYGVIAITTRVR